MVINDDDALTRANSELQQLLDNGKSGDDRRRLELEAAISDYHQRLGGTDPKAGRPKQS